MLAEQVDPLGREPVEGLEVQRRDQATPQLAELELVARQLKVDLLDVCARARSRLRAAAATIASTRASTGKPPKSGL